MTEPYPFHAEDDQSLEQAARRLPETDLRPGSPTARALDEALAGLRPMGLDLAVVEAAARRQAEQEAEAQAGELYRAALRRYSFDPVAHMRAELAATVAVGVYRHRTGPDGTQHIDDPDRDLARLAAAVALEVVERERPTAEAALTRIRDVLRRHLEDGPRPTDTETVTALLHRLDEVRAAMVDPA